MPLDNPGMYRLGLGIVYRITPVLIATVLYGLYIASLILATYALVKRGLKNRSNLFILVILYALFCLTSALWALEVAQLFAHAGSILLHPNDLPAEENFKHLYSVISVETSYTGKLYKLQMIVGDVLVIWRAMAVWSDRRLVTLIPWLFWALMVVDTIINVSLCRSGLSEVHYGKVCKVTDVAAPTLSILVNLAVMSLFIWKALSMPDLVRKAIQTKKKDRVFKLFVLLIESGTLYVLMLTAHLLLTSVIIAPVPESIERVIQCISGYTTVQFVAIYPTLMLVVLQRSIWNAPGSSVVVSSSNILSTCVPSARSRSDTEQGGNHGKVAPKFGKGKVNIENDMSVGSWHVAPPSQSTTSHSSW